MTQLLQLHEIPGMVFSTACHLVGLGATNRQLLRMKDAEKLLSDDYHTIESGYGVAGDGLLCVAACVYMKGVTPEMLDYWFSTLRTGGTERYKLWHPRDHISSDWEGPTGDDWINGHHLVEEMIGDMKTKLKISFESPSKYFGKDFKAKFEKAGYGTAVCGRTSIWDDRRQDYLPTGHLLHLVKLEPDGCRMRSRFWLGDVQGVPLHVGHFMPEKIGSGLMQHCIEEMSILASILPDLYAKETGKKLQF